MRSGGEEVFELFSLEKRNLEKVDNNAVRCFGVTSCAEETKAQPNRSTPVCQWAFERCKSCAENDLRIDTTDGRRQPGRRGAENNRAGRLRGIHPRLRNRLREISLRRPARIREMPIVVARRSNRETIGRAASRQCVRASPDLLAAGGQIVVALDAGGITLERPIEGVGFALGEPEPLELAAERFVGVAIGEGQRFGLGQ